MVVFIMGWFIHPIFNNRKFKKWHIYFSVRTYRKAHVSELLDETVHDPSLIWLAHLHLETHKQSIKI